MNNDKTNDMSDDIENTIKSNLVEIMEMYDLKQKDLLDILGVSSIQMVQNYLNDYTLPIQKAIRLSEYAEKKKKKKDKSYEIDNKNFLSLDWIYCRSPYMNERDLMTNILFSLSKIFKITARRTHNGNDNVLLIDSRFRDFLFDMNDLDSLWEDEDISIDTFNSMRKDKYKKHKKFLYEIFGSASFKDSEALEIHKVESSNNYKEIYLLDILEAKGKDVSIKNELETDKIPLNDGSSDTIKKIGIKKYD